MRVLGGILFQTHFCFRVEIRSLGIQGMARHGMAEAPSRATQWSVTASAVPATLKSLTLWPVSVSLPG